MGDGLAGLRGAHDVERVRDRTAGGDVEGGPGSDEVALDELVDALGRDQVGDRVHPGVEAVEDPAEGDVVGLSDGGKHELRVERGVPGGGEERDRRVVQLGGVPADPAR